MRTNYIVLLCWVAIVAWPRLLLAWLSFGVAQMFRIVAKVVGVECGRTVTNRRILFITDYMPPQTHGIAIRCHAYVSEMRRQGHQVVVFATAYDATKETSFDHPNIPSVVNPFNLKNRIGYTPGVKLAWYLGAHTWDAVHLVFPSLISNFVLPACYIRGIPAYCSHHVEMDIFSKHSPWPLDRIGLGLYHYLFLVPALTLGTMNAAPTLCFAKAHCGSFPEDKLRCVPSGTHPVFTSELSSTDERSEVRRSMFGVTDEDTKVVIMVQRLSQEKGTHRIFPAFLPRAQGGEGVKGVLAIAGDGPSMNFLRDEAEKKNLPVVFLGNVPHNDLPKLYRSADCFVTMSLSETFGLTSLEAQMCGCPAVMPYCAVFDEIWSHRIPKSWRYNIESTAELARSITVAMEGGRQFLKENPVRQTWKDATMELLGHYEECIQLTEKATMQKKKVVDVIITWVRIACVLIVAAVITRPYYSAAKSFAIWSRKSGLS